MYSKHISPSASTSNSLFNCPHALGTKLTKCHHVEAFIQLPPCRQNKFHSVPSPQPPLSTFRMLAKHILPSATTSNAIFNRPHALQTHLTQWHHLQTPFQLRPYPPNTFHPMPPPGDPISNAPMPSKHISPGGITSTPLFNCLHACKTHFTQCHHLKPPFELPPCPRNTFHPLPPPPNPFPTALMPSTYIAATATTSKTPFKLPPCSQNTSHAVPPLETAFLTASMPSKLISPTATTSNALFNCPYALKTHFT